MSRNPPISISIPFLFTLLSPYLMPTMASTPAPSSIPQVDFSRMGSVGLGGSFSGLDWWSSSSPFASSSTSATFSTDGDTVFVRQANGSYAVLGSTNSGGTINALCWSNSSASDSSNGTLYIGGSFSSIGSTSSSNIVACSLSDNTFQSLSDGVSGPVNTLYCDNTNSEVWVGGSFNSSGNLALWSIASSAWTEIPFGGLNGPVEDISSNGSSIYFSGAFTTSYLSNSSSLVNTTSNFTSAQSAPSNTSTVGHSGYLTPVTMPSISSSAGNLTITAGPSTNQKQYSDADVLLCPGRGTWLAENNTVAQVDVKGYNYWIATGARVANAHVEGRGATAFCITSLPDNTQLNMTYTDPTTGKNETCWEYCPLSTDATIGAQDFLFTDGPRNLTGLQMELKRWIGDGPGLSSVQLLSDGAYGSAVDAGNTGPCSSKSSSVQQTGDWKQATTDTDIAGTTAYYLTSTVPVSNPTHPSVTFYPYVSASGYYDVYVLIPGCEQIGDCAGRTSVDMEVFPIQNGLGWTSTISEQVNQDTKSLVYSGWIDATSDAFSPTIILALAQNPLSPSSGGDYIVVAQAVQLTLTGVATNGSTSTAGSSSTVNGTTVNSTMTTNSSSQVAFGVFEWSRSSASGVNAISQLANTTETALTHLGFGLETVLHSTSSTSQWSVSAIASLNNIIYVAGDFSASGNYSNVISVDASTGQITPLADQGLDGTVHAIEVIGQYIYFGGQFTSTASGGVGLAHLARYDPTSSSWAAVAGGVDGTVTALSSTSTRLVVLGNFSNVLAADGTSTQTGGYAVYDTSSSLWSTDGIVFGTLSAGATNDDQTYLAGKVFGSSSNPVSGVAMLSTSDGSATINTLTGAALSAPIASTSTLSKRRIHTTRASYTRTWLSRFADVIAAQASPILTSRATAPTITSTAVQAPAVLAGSFWTNSSASGDARSVTILGGNFSANSDVSGLAFYANDQLTGTNPPVQGVVRTLAVVGDSVYVGGTGVNATNIGSGLLVYNLQSNSWVTGGMPSLNPSGSTVNAVRDRTNTDTVVVAGDFTSAGSLTCAALCLWDTKNAQWLTPGSGLLSGEVRAIDFAGDSYDTVVVAGSFVMSDGTVAYAATFSFDNSTWTALGSLPGPALAVAADNKNASNIFAAGYSTSDGTTYLQQWNGKTWSAQNSTLLPGSVVQQLAFVPMSTEHTPVGSIEKNRMLMVSGDLYLQGTGNATSALYDGASWYPYLVGTTSSGSLGAGSGLFWSETAFSFDVRHLLARGLVVLVAIAIATGLILLLILLALLIAFLTRRSERRSTLVQREMFDKEGSEISSTHQNIFHGVQTALEQSLGAGAGAGIIAARRTSEDSEYDTGDEEEDEENEGGRETTMRYEFDGPELQPGEMAMRAGQPIIILDDVQSPEWWYARDPSTGREGVVPASYVW